MEDKESDDERYAGAILGCFTIVALILGLALFAGIVVWVWKHALS